MDIEKERNEAIKRGTSSKIRQRMELDEGTKYSEKEWSEITTTVENYHRNIPDGGKL